MPRQTAARERPDIPKFLFTRLRMTPACWAARARRRPRLMLTVAVLAATAAVAALVLVTWPGPGGCRVAVAAAPGERAHWACAAAR